MHPEAGHLHVPRLPGYDFAGVCPFHGDCLEGLASGTAIAARAGMTADLLPEEHPAWLPVADALAHGIVSLMLTLACERIIIGGGVGLGRPHLLEMVRARISEKIGGYLPSLGEADIKATVIHAALGRALLHWGRCRWLKQHARVDSSIERECKQLSAYMPNRTFSKGAWRQYQSHSVERDGDI